MSALSGTLVELWVGWMARLQHLLVLLTDDGAP